MPLFFFLAFVILYLVFKNGEKGFWEHLVKEIRTIIPLVVLGVLLSYVFDLIVPENIMNFVPQSYLLFSVLGILVPTMRYGLYPLLFLLHQKGVSIGRLVSFLAADEMAEPPSVLVEIKYMGKRFFFYRILLTIVIAVMAGFIADSVSLSLNGSLAGSYSRGAGDIELLLIVPSAIGIGLIIESFFKKTIKSGPGSWLSSTVLGILAPGPLVAYLPTLGKLRKKIGFSNIAAFITGQTLCGPVRMSLELYMFGPSFIGLRLGLAIIMGLLAGGVTKLVDTAKLL